MSNGATQRSNNYMLDGAIMQNFYGMNNASVANTTLGVDGIKEFKTITSLFSAEYGMTMGSQTTIVSKGGANAFHGDAFEFIRNSALDARNVFDLPQIPKFKQNQFGGAFGGPIKKDKTFFWGVFEGFRNNLGLTTRSGVPACVVSRRAAEHSGWRQQQIQAADCPQVATNDGDESLMSLALLASYPLSECWDHC